MKKMYLDNIKVKSFVTIVDREEKIKGGYSALDCTPDFTRYPNCPKQAIIHDPYTGSQNNM